MDLLKPLGRSLAVAFSSISIAGCASSDRSTDLASQDATPGYNTRIPESVLTPDRVDTSIGTLEFFDGLPDEATVRTVYDNLDRVRGTEVFLNFIPMASLEGLRIAHFETDASAPVVRRRPAQFFRLGGRMISGLGAF